MCGSVCRYSGACMQSLHNVQRENIFVLIKHSETFSPERKNPKQLSLGKFIICCDNEVGRTFNKFFMEKRFPLSAFARQKKSFIGADVPLELTGSHQAFLYS